MSGAHQEQLINDGRPSKVLRRVKRVLLNVRRGYGGDAVDRGQTSQADNVDAFMMQQADGAYNGGKKVHQNGCCARSMKLGAYKLQGVAGRVCW
jgi:hypothetical protein